ncbi:adenosine deaminase [Stackebrandtia endophytica]|uniref:adenosine deaminase n=1 Tax=Stackebrandtia endophytica TaxID=1496996 RepID=A0A543B319_9ACTN|nr:hypothetical protein [Stackebrandtia endophytica]TQL79216.1 adenosine deaminase [Stackebrandtia endophytica]
MLPKADVHLHEEWSPRLDRVLANRNGTTPFDWATWRAELQENVPAGLARLQQLSRVSPAPVEADTDAAFFQRVVDTLTESAESGSHYTELRFGNDTVLRPGFMRMFRDAEAQVRQRHPRFRAEAIISVLMWYEPRRLYRIIDACEAAADDGLAGIDILYVPYAAEADWRTARHVVGLARDAGLGITVHAGEFSPANIAAVAGIDGVTRIGHATHAAADPRLLSLLVERDITVEVCLTANLLLGAVAGLADHPLPRMLDAGVKVALGSDNPVQFGSTIEEEYHLAAELGLSMEQLTDLTRNAVRAGFTTPERKADLLADLDRAGASLPA